MFKDSKRKEVIILINKFIDYFIAIFYSFRQSLKFLSEEHWNFLGGNLDFFYIPALFYLKDNYKNKEKLKKIFIFIMIFIGYSFIQIIFNHELNITKLMINIFKIFICFMVYLYAKENYQKFNYFKIFMLVTLILFFLTCLSFVFNTSTFFWRFNDGVNLFSLTRLQLFYLEPSELGFHLIPIIILMCSLFLHSKSHKRQLILIGIISILLIPLYLAKPMGAIGIGLVSIALLILYDYYLKPSKYKRNMIIFLVAISIFILWIMCVTNNPLIERVLYTLSGNDGSNNYRIGVSLNVLKESLIDYKFIGCGFGNLNTFSFISRYTSLGLSTVVVNSFIYFIIESGIFGIFFVSCLIFLLYKKTFETKSTFKFGLTTFIVLYSLVGGHFTSGLVWFFYGLVLSELNDTFLLNQYNLEITNLKSKSNKLKSKFNELKKGKK